MTTKLRSRLRPAQAGAGAAHRLRLLNEEASIGDAEEASIGDAEEASLEAVFNSSTNAFSGYKFKERYMLCPSPRKPQPKILCAFPTLPASDPKTPRIVMAGTQKNCVLAELSGAQGLALEEGWAEEKDYIDAIDELRYWQQSLAALQQQRASEGGYAAALPVYPDEWGNAPHLQVVLNSKILFVYPPPDNGGRPTVLQVEQGHTFTAARLQQDGTVIIDESAVDEGAEEMHLFYLSAVGSTRADAPYIWGIVPTHGMGTLQERRNTQISTVGTLIPDDELSIEMLPVMEAMARYALKTGLGANAAYFRYKSILLGNRFANKSGSIAPRNVDEGWAAKHARLAAATLEREDAHKTASRLSSNYRAAAAALEEPQASSRGAAAAALEEPQASSRGAAPSPTAAAPQYLAIAQRLILATIVGLPLTQESASAKEAASLEALYGDDASEWEGWLAACGVEQHAAALPLGSSRPLWWLAGLLEHEEAAPLFAPATRLDGSHDVAVIRAGRARQWLPAPLATPSGSVWRTEEELLALCELLPTYGTGAWIPAWLLPPAAREAALETLQASRWDTDASYRHPRFWSASLHGADYAAFYEAIGETRLASRLYWDETTEKGYALAEQQVNDMLRARAAPRLRLSEGASSLLSKEAPLLSREAPLLSKEAPLLSKEAQTFLGDRLVSYELSHKYLYRLPRKRLDMVYGATAMLRVDELQRLSLFRQQMIPLLMQKKQDIAALSHSIEEWHKRRPDAALWLPTGATPSAEPSISDVLVDDEEGDIE